MLKWMSSENYFMFRSQPLSAVVFLHSHSHVLNSITNQLSYTPSPESLHVCLLHIPIPGHVSKDQRSISSSFLSHFLPYFLRQGMSLNSEFGNSVRLASQEHPVFACLHTLSVLGFKPSATIDNFYMDAESMQSLMLVWHTLSLRCHLSIPCIKLFE